MTRALLVVFGAAALLFVVAANWSDIALWAQTEQRSMQNQLARAIQSVRSGDQFAIASLVGACLMYGLLHAIGPGHGKFLIGGAAVASRRTAWRMATIGFSSSLMQAVSAIILAYGGLGLASVTGSAVLNSAQGFLVPLSFVAMAIVGVWIAIRGIRLMANTLSHEDMHAHTPHAQQHSQINTQSYGHHNSHHANHVHSGHAHSDHVHSGQCAAGCRHIPTVDEAEKAESWRGVAALVFSIGIRPCSGALIVLIISWHFGLYAVGALATFAMAVGTGLVVGLVALFATTVRDSGLFRLSKDGESISMASFGRLQVLAGSLVVVVCAVFIFSGVSTPTPTGLIR